MTPATWQQKREQLADLLRPAVG